MLDDQSVQRMRVVCDGESTIEKSTCKFLATRSALAEPNDSTLAAARTTAAS
jgi:hypothetical protein